MTLVRRLRRTLLLSTSALLAACGGGGGGGGSSAPIDFNTAEYRASYGNAAINAIAAYTAGYSGRGVTVGVIDSGIDIDHPDFAGAIHAASADMLGRGTVDDSGGHGTLVAGVIGARRNDFGMHGVAYDSRLLAVRTETSCSPGCTYSNSALAAGTDYATANGATVLNYSLGGSAIASSFEDALARAVAGGAIVVAAAGNTAGAEPIQPAAWAADPDANGQAIAVGAVDQNNAIASFSNRAGSVRNQFLVAPGVGVYTTSNDGGFSTVSGTSFAAPHVAGAAAVLKQRFPNLSARQIVDILLSSATDLGDPGTDAVYGRGLLNLETALQPLGATTVPGGTSAAQGGAALDGSALRLGAAFGDALADEPGLGRVLFLDGYDRPYLADLSGAVRPEHSGIDLEDWLTGGRRHRSVRTDLGAMGSLRVDFEEAGDSLLPAGVRDDDPLDDARFAWSGDLGAGSRATFAQGFALDRRFGLADAPGLAGVGLLGRDAFGAPHLSLVGEGSSVVVEGRLDGAVGYRLGAVSSDGSALDDPDAPERTGWAAEIFHHDGRRRWGVMLGGLEEQGSVLGTTGDAAFGFGGSVETRFAGAFGSVPIGPVDLFGSYTIGWTDAAAIAGNLLTEMSSLRSETFSVGAGVSDVLRDGDRLTLAISRPLKVTGGTATLDRPVGYRLDGSIVRAVDEVGLTPSGNEIDAEIGYVLDLGADQQLRFNVMTQFEPGHVDDAKPEVVGGVRYTVRF